jgi:multisubunit Na+/H+ antiporter MnhE subunit
MKHVATWLGWWIGLFWVWLLLAGVWNTEELVAAAAAATLAASVAELARTRTAPGARLPLRALADIPELLVMIVVDFALVVWALLVSVARREMVRGGFTTRELRRRADASTSGTRAWVALAASYSPNAYVVDVGADATVVVHDLVPNRRSESPA